MKRMTRPSRVIAVALAAAVVLGAALPGGAVVCIGEAGSVAIVGPHGCGAGGHGAVCGHCAEGGDAADAAACVTGAICADCRDVSVVIDEWRRDETEAAGECVVFAAPLIGMVDFTGCECDVRDASRAHSPPDGLAVVRCTVLLL